MDSLTSLPSERTVGGLCADDLGSTITLAVNDHEQTLRLVVIHHETGSHGQPLTYLSDGSEDAPIMLPSATPCR